MLPNTAWKNITQTWKSVTIGCGFQLRLGPQCCFQKVPCPGHLSAAISHPQCLCQAPLFHPNPTDDLAPTSQRTGSQNNGNSLSCQPHQQVFLHLHPFSPTSPSLEERRNLPGCLKPLLPTHSMTSSLVPPCPWFLALNFTLARDSPLLENNKTIITFPSILQPLPLILLSPFLSSQ